MGAPVCSQQLERREPLRLKFRIFAESWELLPTGRWVLRWGGYFSAELQKCIAAPNFLLSFLVVYDNDYST